MKLSIKFAALQTGAVVKRANKHRGGLSGKKGSRYEDYFAVSQCIVHALPVLQHIDQVTLTPQADAWVDDLVVHHNQHVHYYQLKNSKLSIGAEVTDSFAATCLSNSTSALKH
jgi:hypothetical protein